MLALYGQRGAADKRAGRRARQPGDGKLPLAFPADLADITGGSFPGSSDHEATMTGQHRKLSVSLMLAGLLVVLALPAGAQSPQFLGSHRDWYVYRYQDGDQAICYMASEPKKQEGNYTRRGNPAVLVTRRPAPRAVDEVSVQPGYTYMDGSEVEVEVDRNRKFLLFTRGEHAWTKSEQADRDLINAMRRGSDMTVRGTSVRNTFSLDTYSLLGFTAAYDAMVAACSDES
jgi:hypothetical protein